MNKNIMNVQVEKADIKKIGNTAFNQNGNLAIVCNGETSNIEEILLRSILKCFGEDYKVISSEDNIWVNVKGEEVYDILFTTNLPYELFEEVWHSEYSADAGNLPDTPKKSSKIVKSILTIIMLVFIGLAANAQEVHGYYKVLANELSSEGFLVTDSGYETEKLKGSLSDLYCLVLTPPNYYDDEQTRLAIVRIMNQYKDVRLVRPWKRETDGDYTTTTASYRCNDTLLNIYIGETDVAVYECIFTKSKKH